MDPARLVIEEDLYLAAVRAITRLESEREDLFDSHTAAEAYLNEPAVRARFEDAAGETFEGHRRSVHLFLDAIHYPQHYNQPLEQWEGERERLTVAVADAVRALGWAFLTAWTQRYGGLMGHIVSRGVVVDPKQLTPNRPT